MSYQHHQMAHVAAATMLRDVRAGKASWSLPERLSARTTYWQGISGWPRPDYAFEDASTGASIAIEFKPPGHERTEYVRGLGQAITYLETFEFSALVVPRYSKDGFEISTYLANLLGSHIKPRLPLAILEYQDNPDQLSPKLPLCMRSDPVPQIPRRGSRKQKVFWAYWRDLSQQELYLLLRLMDRDEVTFDSAFQKFWQDYRSQGKTLTWEGTARKPATSPKYYKSERINCMLSLRHLQLVDSNGRITQEGYDLLRHGNVYGSESLSFKLLLGQQILTAGRHIELIFWVEDVQRDLPREKKTSLRGFLSALDEELEKAGVIGSAPRGRPKETFIRDEPKLWNKLGLLKKRNKNSYFFPDEGFRFDWRLCIEMVNYK